MKSKAWYSSLGVMMAMVLLLAALAAVQAATRTLYVNGTAGTDNATCGLTEAAPCKTIGYAVKNRALAGDTVKVAAGTYAESIIIDKDKLSLLGAGVTTTAIAAVSSTANAVTLGSGTKNITVNGFTIQGGSNGIFLADQSLATVQECILQNNGRGFYAAANSVGKLVSVVARNNATGVSFSANSTGGLHNSTLTQNTGDGLVVNLNSHAKLMNCLVTSNQNGVTVYGESSIYLVGTKVSNNKLRGLNITSHAHASLWGGNTISANGPVPNVPHQAGISIYNGSQVSIVPSPLSTVKDVISANNGPGIYVGDKSELLITFGAVTNNNLDGVRLAHDSSAQFDAGASITLNKGYGIRCTDLAGDSKYGGTPGDLSGNVLGPTKCAKFDP